MDAAASSSSTPNGQHSLLNQDTDSSSSNAFYGQNFGINLIDDSSLTSLAANPAQLQQLINFSVSTGKGRSGLRKEYNIRYNGFFLS